MAPTRKVRISRKKQKDTVGTGEDVPAPKKVSKQGEFSGTSKSNSNESEEDEILKLCPEEEPLTETDRVIKDLSSNDDEVNHADTSNSNDENEYSSPPKSFNGQRRSTNSRSRSTSSKSSRSRSRSTSSKSSKTSSRNSSSSSSLSSSPVRKKRQHRRRNHRNDTINPATIQALTQIVKMVFEEKNNSNSLSFSNAVNQLTSEEARWAVLDKKFGNSFVPRVYAEHEKLTGVNNFLHWEELIKLELKTQNLTGFIKVNKAEGLIEVSPAKREQLDAQALHLIRNSISKNIVSTIRNTESAFSAMQELEKLYNGNRMLDLVTLDNKFDNLRFMVGFSRERFVGDYKRYLEEYEKRGTSYSDEHKISRFLQKIEGIFDPYNQFNTFFNQIATTDKEKLTFQYVAEKFLQMAVKNSNKEQTLKRKNANLSNSSGFNKANVSKKPRFDNSKREDLQKKPNVSGQSKKPVEKNVAKGDKFAAVPLHKKYTKEQMDQLKSMTSEEKEKVRCSKCQEYFHDEKSCPRPGPHCFACKRYDHVLKDCKYLKKN